MSRAGLGMAVRFSQEPGSSGKPMVMRHAQGQARIGSGEGLDTAQWLPGMHSDEAGLGTGREGSPQVRAQINGGHGQTPA